MPQIDPKSLDYLSEMRAFFDKVITSLIDQHRLAPRQASDLVNRFFALDVEPLERALLMHADADQVAADLAGTTDQQVRFL